MSKGMSKRRSWRADAKAVKDVMAAAIDRDRPLMAHLVVTRRCNLSCGYCHEYDQVSPPVPFATLCERIDHLARLRTVFVTLTGGEPLLHPQLADVVAHIRARGMTPVMNTNGFLLSRERIVALGQAGLFAMQISVDGVTPNAVTKKTLKPLLPKLRLLAAHATFRVRVNTVLGAAPPAEAVEVARVAMGLGFDAKVALLREADGVPRPLDAATRAAYDEIRGLGRRAPAALDEDFQIAMLEDGHVDWKCRAGARFFHVCEDGRVHLCAPRWGAPGTPIAEYTVDDIRRAFDHVKSCAPTCPVAYAHQGSRLDRWRGQREVEALAPAPIPADGKRHLRVVA
jgi:MoaA/NifB/PqqE/SkfB family radical SAM enzyme